MSYRDEASILDQKYEQQINILESYYQRFKILEIIEENAYLKKNNTEQQRTHKFEF